MKSVVIAGGSGIVGTRLTQVLSESGYNAFILTRDDKKAKEHDHFIHWDIKKGVIDDRYEQADIIINLAGSGIAEGRWTTQRKEEILSSRIDSTKLLISEASRRNMKVTAYISASAIGYYGDGGTQLLIEEDDVQTDEFLSQVCVAWEDVAHESSSITDKVSILRIGTVLSPSGGALEKMSVTIPYGIANYLGNGRQHMSWIHLDDLCYMIMFCIDEQLQGIYNAVAPEVVSNKSFTSALRDAINPKALLLSAPAIGIKLAFGEMSRVVLNSSNVDASKIINAGYKFLYPTVDQALTHLYPKK